MVRDSSVPDHASIFSSCFSRADRLGVDALFKERSLIFAGSHAPKVSLTAGGGALGARIIVR